MEKVIITTDLSSMKEEVIKVGLDLARKLDATVDLITVVNNQIDFEPMDYSMGVNERWMARQLYAENELKEVKDAYPEMDIDVVVFVGDPKVEIIDHAIERDASMIVMGTHGRTGIANWVMGSTAEYIVRHSPVPVFVIPYNKSRH